MLSQYNSLACNQRCIRTEVRFASSVRFEIFWACSSVRFSVRIFLTVRFSVRFFEQFGYQLSDLAISSIFFIICLFQPTTAVGRRNESQVWKLEIGSVKLFTNLTKNEAQCSVCVDSTTNVSKNIKIVDGNTKVLKDHVALHSDYQTQLNHLKAQKEKLRNVFELLWQRKVGAISKLLIEEFVGIPADDRNIINYIACTNQPFSILEHVTSKFSL